MELIFMKITLIIMAVSSILSAVAAQAAPAICSKYVATLTDNSADVIIISYQRDWDPEARRYTDEGTKVSGAVTMSCKEVYDGGDTVCRDYKVGRIQLLSQTECD
jgi:hypothetical protein